MTERMTERLFPTIRKQTLFLKALEEKKSEAVSDSPSCGRQEACRTDSEVLPVGASASTAESRNIQTVGLNAFPPLVRMALQKEDDELKCSRRTKMKSMLIQALFDQISQVSMYPSHRQYVEFLSNFITNFPFLREKTGSGYDALHQSLRNKMKKERRPLVNDEVVQRMKEKFRIAGSGRKRQLPTEEPQVLTRTRRPEVVSDSNPVGEDERSIASHVLTMQVEAEKARPNFEVLQTNMAKTRAFRTDFIMGHTTRETLTKFPCLKMPKLLLWDMKAVYGIDVDRMVVNNLGMMAYNIIRRAPTSDIGRKCTTAISNCLDDKERKEQQLRAAILLLPSLFREDPSALYLIEKMPEAPTPVVRLLNCQEGNPLNPDRVLIHMDDTEVINEDASMDISFALGMVFCLYYIYGIVYPKTLAKTLLFLERFVFKLNKNEKVPVTVSRVYNSLVE